MNSDSGLVPTNISEVIDKFNQSIRKFAIKETEWFIQKGNYDIKIAELEGQLKAHENINIDLLKRVRMLEYALSQESRLKNPKGDSDNEVLKFNNQIILNDIEDKRQLIKPEDLKIMKEKSVRPSLLAMLNDIGINENLANNLFIDLELNKTELERLVKSNIDEKLNQILNEPTKLKSANNKENPPNSNSNQIECSENNRNLFINPSEQSELNPTKIDKLEQEKNYNLNFSNYIELKSHFDVIRKVGYMPSINSLISVSEDCLIKVWSLSNLNFSNISCDTEPYLVLRGHTGPLFSLAIAPENNNLIYTAGNEGIIKIWKIPKPEEVNQYGDADTIFNYNVGFYQIPNEVVWDLKHHPKQKLLVSLSTDGFVNIWETGTAEEHLNALSEMQYDKWLKSSKSRPNLDSGTETPIPTTCCFLNSDGNQLICGFTDSYISTFDFNKLIFSSNIKSTKIDRNSDYSLSQVNCLINSTSVPTIYAGYEDNAIKTIDMRSEMVTNSITAHSDAITSLNLFNDIYLFSTSHDTKIRMWDIRNMNSSIQETIGSQKKWDEAMWHSTLITSQLMLATAGADSVIKIFKL